MQKRLFTQQNVEISERSLDAQPAPLSTAQLQCVGGGFTNGLSLAYIPRALPVGWVPLPGPIVW